MATQIKVTAQMSARNGSFVFPQVGGAYNLVQGRYGGGAPGIVTLEMSGGSPVDEFVDLSEVQTPGWLWMANCNPAEAGAKLNRNTIQRVKLEGVTEGTFRLEFDDMLTEPIAYNAIARDVESAIGALKNVGRTGVVVTGSPGDWLVEFIGDLAALDLPVMRIVGDALVAGEHYGTVTTVTQGLAASNEIQRVALGEGISGGTFTLSYEGQSTAAIAYDASAGGVKTAIEALNNIDEVNVTKVASYWEVEFTGAHAGTDVVQLTGSAGASGSVVTTQEGEEGDPPSEYMQEMYFAGDSALYNGDEYAAWRIGIIVLNPMQEPEITWLEWRGLSNTLASAIQGDIDWQLSGLATVSRSGSSQADYVYRLEFSSEPEGRAVYQTRTDMYDYGSEPKQFSLAPSESPGADDIQVVTISGSGGTFTLTFEDETTDPIAYNASAGAVESALEALDNIEEGEVSVTGSAGGPYTVTFQMDRDVDEMTINTSGLVGGSVSVTTIVQGAPGRNERQRVSAGGGSFALTFDGQTTGAIAADASAATVKTALESLSTVDTVNVTKGAPYWEVEFVGDHTGMNVTQLAVASSSLTGSASGNVRTEQEGSAGGGEGWELRFADYADTGFETWSVGLIGPFSRDVSVSEVQSFIDQAGVEDIIVSRIGDSTASYVFRFTNTQAQNAPTGRLYDNNGATILNITLAPISSDPTPEIQVVTLTGAPTGGTFTLTFEGKTTSTIAYNASAATVQAELEALDNLVEGEVTVTGSNGGPYTVTFELERDVGQMTIDASGLSGAGLQVSTVAQATEGRNERQKIILSGEPVGGTFTLTLDDQTTDPIAYNASAATVKTELEKLSNITAVNVLATADGWTVEFTDPGYQDVPLLLIDTENIEYPASASAQLVQAGARNNAITWGVKVDNELVPVGWLFPGEPALFRLLPSAVIGFRPTVHGQRVQMFVLES